MFRNIIPSSFSNLGGNKVARTEGRNTVLLNQQFRDDFDRTLRRYSQILSDVIQYNQQNSVEMDNRNHFKDHMPNKVLKRRS